MRHAVRQRRPAHAGKVGPQFSRGWLVSLSLGQAGFLSSLSGRSPHVERLLSCRHGRALRHYRVRACRLRKPDPRIATAVRRALGAADSVVNVGAGAGSYEPPDRYVVAVEPSMTMIAQRSARSASVVQATAMSLPFQPDSFDAALAVLTVHHWPDKALGLSELRRIARRHVVVLTWDRAAPGILVDRLLSRAPRYRSPVVPRGQRFRVCVGARDGGNDSDSPRLHRRLPRHALATARRLSRCTRPPIRQGFRVTRARRLTIWRPIAQ